MTKFKIYTFFITIESKKDSLLLEAEYITKNLIVAEDERKDLVFKLHSSLKDFIEKKKKDSPIYKRKLEGTELDLRTHTVFGPVESLDEIPEGYVLDEFVFM